MTDTFEFTLNSPLTEEQWDTITDVDFDRTDRITFHTKHGKEVEFAKVVRCKDCKHRPHKNKDGYIMPPRVQVGVYAWGEPEYDDDESCPYVCEDRWYNRIPNDEQYCDRAEPKEADE